ncbi:MAG TPA: hypothetical protein VL286_08015 [Rhizomicrobium sp.]|nr:hypothetical protein [Rhizomicrobium sp.]
MIDDDVIAKIRILVGLDFFHVELPIIRLVAARLDDHAVAGRIDRHAEAEVVSFLSSSLRIMRFCSPTTTKSYE